MRTILNDNETSLEDIKEGLIERGLRGRNTRLVDCLEGDIIIDGSHAYVVTHGEVSIYANGMLNVANGGVNSADSNTIRTAIQQGKEIHDLAELNMEADLEEDFD